jgi:hypothetical protein
MNNWGGDGNTLALGIGNRPTSSPDWTFANNAGTDYTRRTLHVLVRPAAAPPLPPPVAANVPSAQGYRHVYTFDLPIYGSFFTSAPAYTVFADTNNLPAHTRAWRIPRAFRPVPRRHSGSGLPMECLHRRPLQDRSPPAPTVSLSRRASRAWMCAPMWTALSTAPDFAPAISRSGPVITDREIQSAFQRQRLDVRFRRRRAVPTAAITDTAPCRSTITAQVYPDTLAINNFNNNKPLGIGIGNRPNAQSGHWTNQRYNALVVQPSAGSTVCVLCAG